MCAEVTENNSFKEPPLISEGFKGNAEYSDPRSELRGNHLTWGATPLDFISDQADVFEKLKKRIDDSAPESTPSDVRKFVKEHFITRFSQRQVRNYESYYYRDLEVAENLDDEYKKILSAGLDGTSNPNHLLKLRKKLKMPSTELARLTHPYGTHMETLDEMRQAIDFAIIYNGGELIDDDSMIKYDVDGGYIHDIGENIELGFLMKRKRVRGNLSDDTEIIERSTFVLRVDKESRLNQDIAQQFREIKIDNNPEWEKQVMEIINANNLLPDLLSNNEFDIAIPLSTTTYAFNQGRVDELQAAKEVKRTSNCASPDWLVKDRKALKVAARKAVLRAIVQSQIAPQSSDSL